MSKGKKVLLIAVLVVAIIAAAVAGLNVLSVNKLLDQGESYGKIEFENQLTPQKDENGNWYFITDGDFKVMHLTDIHIGGGFLSKEVDRKALNAVATMVIKEKPDLVVYSGDQIWNYASFKGSKDTVKAVLSKLTMVSTLTVVLVACLKVLSLIQQSVVSH